MVRARRAKPSSLRRYGAVVVLVAVALVLDGCTGASESLPAVEVQVDSGQGESLTMGVQLLLLLTVLSLVPAVLMMVTSFIKKIAIVLSFAVLTDEDSADDACEALQPPSLLGKKVDVTVGAGPEQAQADESASPAQRSSAGSVPAAGRE